MRTTDLAGRRLALWGYGREGRSTFAHLRTHLPDLEIAILNDAPLDPSPPELAGSELITGPDVHAALARFEVVVKSPGISLYRPEIAAARERGTLFTSATQIFFDDHPRIRTVAITGTKGKSTTASLLTHLLRAVGLRAELRGNIGSPLLDPMPEPAPDIWVVELSSYQTADLDAAPEVAVLLNLYPEHLDWHGDASTYFHDKLRLFRGQMRAGLGRAVVRREEAEDTRWAGTFREPLRFDDPEGLHTDAEGILRLGSQRLATPQDLALRGRHNLENACAALAGASLLGIAPERCLDGLASFQALPHRLEPLGEHSGLLWIDDSISTTPQSTMAAIAAYASSDARSLSVLLGGFDRGLAYEELAQFLIDQEVGTVVTMGQNGPRIADAILEAQGDHLHPAVHEAASLWEAVDIARRETQAGGVVLLSPAAPSYDAFSSFEERGRSFCRAVRA